MKSHLASITIVIGLVQPAAAAAAEIAWTGITVRVYNTTELPSADLRAALDTAGATLARANVEVTWRDCTSEGLATTACNAPMARGELAIRILRLPTPSKDPRSAPLGDALVDAHKGHGVLGTLYFDRVQWLAGAAGAKVSTLLGHAIAHELGHLLVATSAHSRHGLMRAVWSRDEVRRGSGRDWAFTKVDITAIQKRHLLTRIADGD